ncbi:fibronectin type III domain-containing protein [Mesorhizobium camelthorni]|uniref:Fibronectin type III domain-containing protein n=1 Tax=Allomesorhizobium camelthorni TaxID=475069 RepID=A0A6G4WA00_9HYPH|nr:fibronectin type III domain-containing protein [Mesorhizobium camelthorni]
MVFAVLASNSITIGLAGSALAISAITGALSIGLSVGLSFLSASLFKQQAPKPEDVQVTTKNPTAPRVRHYGRTKMSGTLAFLESKNGAIYKVIATGTGQLDAIEEYYVDDRLVTLDGSGWVNSGGELNGQVRIRSRLGLPTETHYSEVTAEFPEWDSSHRGDGVSSIFVQQTGVRAEDFSETFPSGAHTLYRIVARTSKVYDPSTATTVWTDNAAAVIRDYIIHSDGMRLPSSLVNTTQAAAGWLTAYNRCTENVPLKAGGTEDSYRIWGSYALNERPADVLGRMLPAADARLVPTPDGGLTLDVGTWAEPTVVLDADAIVGFTELSRGRDVLTTANIIRATYTSPFHDYQATDADQWIDEDDVALRGEIVSDLAFNMSPSHGQTRRLMKLAAYRAKPNWIGSFSCNLKAMAAFGKRFVRITYPLFSIDEVFEIQDFRFDIGEGGILQGVTLQVASMPSVAYDWDAATEEGTEPISEETTVDRTIPLPTNFSFTVDRITVGTSLVPFGVLAFDAPPSVSLKVQGRYKLTSAGDTEWNTVSIAEGATEGQTAALSDGSEYEAQVRHVTITGRTGEWTDSEITTPVADTTAPGPVTGVGAVGGVGEVDLSWTSPNSANFSAVNIRRNTVNVEGSAALVHTEYGPASNSDAYTDAALAPATYYYWLKARNGSGVESASVATGAVVVT